ncbi:MAG: B12-binding domain-containing radical SAM protein [Phycisphaerales bacterium]|nr:MAG: B12-binding domain-containing radical SAM protein [Phycisphaerales bacterium]
MKILLIDPPFYRLMGFYNRYFPLGLVCIGTVLAEAGHEVAIYDADCNEAPSVMDYTRLGEYHATYLETFRQPGHPVWTQMRRTIQNEKPDVIGISIWTAYAASAFHVADLAKEWRADCPVIMGGPHATVKADEILRICPAVDCVLRGQGEQTIVELIQRIAHQRDDFEGLDGVSFRRDGAIRHNPWEKQIPDLERLASPDRSLLMNHDKYSPEDMGLIMTSRGCPFSCAFCATDTNRVCYRAIENIIAEIRLVRRRYGTNQFSFKDDSFTVDRRRVGDFCAALAAENLNIGWECNTRVDLINEEMLTCMKRAGCNSIKVGVESGSEAVLERMNKRIGLDQIRAAARLLRQTGIHWTAYFLVGTPGETEKDVYRTLDLMYEIRPDFASIGVYEPFPGTAMFEEGIRRGLVKAEMTREEFYVTLPKDYYKTDGRQQVDTIDPARFAVLESEIKAKFHAYNKGWGRLFKRARSRAKLYVHHPAALATDFKKFLSWS